jgi:hypothetical protein
LFDHLPDRSGREVTRRQGSTRDTPGHLVEEYRHSAGPVVTLVAEHVLAATVRLYRYPCRCEKTRRTIKCSSPEFGGDGGNLEDQNATMDW